MPIDVSVLLHFKKRWTKEWKHSAGNNPTQAKYWLAVFIYHIILQLHMKAGQNKFPFSLENSHLINKMYIYRLKMSLHIKFYIWMEEKKTEVHCCFFFKPVIQSKPIIITEIKQCRVAHFTLFFIMPSNNLCCSTTFARQRKNTYEKDRRLEERKGRFLLDLHQ